MLQSDEKFVVIREVTKGNDTPTLLEILGFLILFPLLIIGLIILFT